MLTFTVTLALVDPVALEHLMLYVVFVLGETVCVPDVVVTVKPVGAVATQLVASVLFQVIALLWPTLIEAGEAVIDTTGGVAVDVGADTVMFVVAVAVPPLPVQLILYVVEAVGATVCVPEVPEIENPVGATAAQLVALVLFHVSTLLWPLVIDAGDAVNVTVGAGVVGVGVGEADE